MKFWLVIASVLFFIVGPGTFAADDRGRRADIVDSTGTRTFVTGLHYCYEEEVGEDLFVNKYDDLFVRRGAATIRVRLDSLAQIDFTGKKEQEGDLSLFEARIRTRTGSESVASVVCHPGGFIKGNIDLGEFQLPLDKVKTMVFPTGTEAARRTVRCVVCDDADQVPEGAIAIALDRSGKLTLRQGAGSKPLDASTELKSKRIVLDVDESVTYPVLRRTLGALAQAGVAEVVLVL